MAFKALLNLSHVAFESIDSRGVFSTTTNFSSLGPKDFVCFDGGIVGGGIVRGGMVGGRMVGFFGRGGGCVDSRGGGVIGGGGGGVGRGDVGKGNVVARGGVRI